MSSRPGKDGFGRFRLFEFEEVAGCFGEDFQKNLKIREKKSIEHVCRYKTRNFHLEAGGNNEPLHQI